MEARILPASPDDIPLLAARMRTADRDEVWALHRHSPEEALRVSLAASTLAWTGWVDGDPVCMFGVGPVSILAGRGAPWLLGSELVERWPRTFLRRCRACVDRMADVYPTLENFVHDRNELSKRWLAWLGFALGPPLRLRNGEVVRHFMKESRNV